MFKNEGGGSTAVWTMFKKTADLVSGGTPKNGSNQPVDHKDETVRGSHPLFKLRSKADRQAWQKLVMLNYQIMKIIILCSGFSSFGGGQSGCRAQKIPNWLRDHGNSHPWPPSIMYRHLLSYFVTYKCIKNCVSNIGYEYCTKINISQFLKPGAPLVSIYIVTTAPTWVPIWEPGFP